MNGKSNGTMSSRELSRLLKEAVEKMDDESPESNGWAAAPAKAVNAPFLGVSIPIKVETPQGSLRCYLSLPPEVAANPQTLLNAIKQLMDMGIPVDLYQPKTQDGGWNGNRGGGNWRNNGGYGGGNGNGYQPRYPSNGFRDNGGRW